ncbi:S8 family peptidase [Desertibacillus haloalkaliphilus]|uniref:S8 family peptidase n=1 Tax=Desertibacillus haloalkaliphilus TaxID=1328930 RepID=UPI001C25DD7D|nr:S8 family serine peptidase [Desertibacillus haloalkaliphilus]MBU8908480.1 S8 family serine peptidase [Desertibacillus haloalkaliphilus]
MNSEVLKKSNIITFHEKGYKGQGVTVAVLDTLHSPLEETEVELPFKENHNGEIGHNTHVCSIVREFAPKARIISMPWFGSGKEEMAQWIVDNDVDIVNCSFTATRPTYELIDEYLSGLNIPLVCSSGNQDNDRISFPARFDWTIAVGAYQKRWGHVAGYSNRGEMLDAVAFTDINVPNPNNKQNGYMSFGGTSASAPAVCGMLACYMSALGEKLNTDQARRFIHDNCIDKYEEGFDTRSGHGLFILPDVPEMKENPVKEEVREVSQVKFADVEGHWAQTAIENQAKKGKLAGYPDGTFKPNETVTRAELAVILERLK